MYVAPVDNEIMSTQEMWDMLDEYEERFGEPFIDFNYADFDGTDDKCSAQVYKEILEKALRDNQPYHIKSKRCSFFTH